MKDVIHRWLGATGYSAIVCAVLTLGTGCGAIKAAANPKVAWAINDPAPMSVVVRRADVAEKTAEGVDHAMTSTPVNDDSAWLGKVAPDGEQAKQQIAEMQKNDLYAGSGGARVVAAEVWAKSLASVEPKPGAAAPAAVAAAQPPPPVAKDAAAHDKADKKAKKGKAVAKADKADKARSKQAPPEAKTEAPAAQPAAAAADVAAKYPSLLAAIDPALGEEWGKVMEKRKALADVKSEIAAEEAALDEKNVSDADKKAHKAKIDELEKKADGLEDEAEKLAKAFVPKAKASAQKASPEVREKFGATLVSLRQAVSDADLSNSAAAVRYPLALKTLLDSAQTMVKVYVGDVVEEKTGKRPNMQSLQPGVTLEGGKVQVTINGLSQDDLGKMSVGDVTSEVAARTTKWVKHAMGLLGTIAATQGTLEFEDDVLGALLDGFKSAGWTAPAAPKVPDSTALGGAAGPPRS